MCTAITYRTKDHYFGRTLDLECSYQECVTITPRNFPFVFRRMGSLSEHYALIGMAAIAENYPLYYEATNEKGLSIAGLNFPGNAVYQPETPGLDNLAPFELIPWILGQCSCVDEARKMLEKICLADIPFSKELPLSPLHWIVSDSERSVVAEPLKDGLKLCENPFGVLTNNPPFGFHQHNLQNYAGLTPLTPVNRFFPKNRAGCLQPRHGSHRAARGCLFRFPLCACRVQWAQFRIRRIGIPKCQPVLSYSRLRRANPRLCTAGRRPICNNRLYLLLQYHPGNLLLYDL